MATNPLRRMTGQDYLLQEREAEHKSEFVDGEVYAMSGGSLRHSLLQGNVQYSMRRQLRKGCTVFTSDLKVVSPRNGSYLYPDGIVVCGPPQAHENSPDVLTNPAVIFEVLSPSTERYDRGKKFELYRAIPSLTDYILVRWDEIFVERFTRQPSGEWLFSEHRGEDAAFDLASVGCRLPLAEIYEGAFDIPG